jgi:cytochrome b involved in lipid metabolism
MKKIISIIIGVLILAGLGFWYIQNQDAKSAEAINNLQAPAEQATASTNVYTLAQVAEHSTANNCWMVINGKVLNVSAFVNSHPGGNVILQACGKDGTDMFNQVRQHAKASVEALKNKFTIGSLTE